jgi:hypothetical protein
MTEFLELIHWGLVISACIFGWFAGWYYARYNYARTYLGGVLFVIYKLDKRGVYFAPYDRAIINVAADFIRATK